MSERKKYVGLYIGNAAVSSDCFNDFEGAKRYAHAWIMNTPSCFRQQVAAKLCISVACATSKCLHLYRLKSGSFTDWERV